MNTKPSPQTAIDERIVESDELEKALEDRERAKGGASEARAKLKTMDDVVKGQLEALGIEVDEPVRVGRFRVSRVAVAAKQVAFETEPTSRLTITAEDDD